MDYHPKRNGDEGRRDRKLGYAGPRYIDFFNLGG